MLGAQAVSLEPDGTSPPSAGPPKQVPPAPAAPPPWRPHFQIAVAAAGLLSVIGVNALVMDRGAPPTPAGASPSATGAARPLARGERTDLPLGDAGAEPAPTASPDAGDAGDAPDAGADEPPHDDDGPPSKPEKRPGTVERAAAQACSTARVDGLSRQIIAEARCLDANAFARVPARRNLVSGGHVFLYLDAPARDHLLRALDAHPKRVMKVHSALRTVAQQYLLSRWAAGKRCGIQLATRPGQSNHETGLALDVADHGAWRSALEREGFRWLGAIDRVHFDFVGPGATHHDGLDVQAFQRLWNRNHPDDTIGESGRYDAATEQRLKKSPAAGFPIGSRCGRGHEKPRASGGGAAKARGR